VITIKSRPTLREVIPPGILYLSLLLDDVWRRHHYVLPAILLLLLVLGGVYSARVGEQLVFTSGRMKHRVPFFCFLVTNQIFATEQIRGLRHSVVRRWFFGDRNALRFTYKGRTYSIGQQLSSEDASKIINAVQALFPHVTGDA